MFIRTSMLFTATVWAAGLALALSGGTLVVADLAGVRNPILAYGAAISACATVALCTTVLRARLDRVAALVNALQDARSGDQVRAGRALPCP